MQHKFNVGDRVKVAKKVPTLAPDGMGAGKSWDNAWTRHMDCFVGRYGRIKQMHGAMGVELEGIGGSYYFPLAALEHVEQLVEA